MNDLIRISRDLSAAVERVRPTTPAYVYNPLEYARAPHELYLERYGSRGARFLLLGMNPGPFGMGQTGVPFGDVPSVRDWLGLEAEVRQPPSAHPKRPVLGFGLKRREGSGKRLWGWAQQRFGTPEAFFAQFFVHNYCPLLFLHESGRNLTPEKLSAQERGALFAVCDQALVRIVDTIGPDVVVGVGKFAEERARNALGDRTEPGVDSILHPSPANPLANTDWAGQIEPVLRRLGARF